MVSIGDEVLDGYAATASWSSTNVRWLEDLTEFYRERATLEREHSQKLAQLAQKHFKKKASHSSALSVGEKPVKTAGSLENASCTAWNEVLTQTENAAKLHDELGGKLAHEIADQLAGVRQRFDELQNFYGEFHTKLESERDHTYNAVKKAKTVYDDACESMESARAKNKKIENKEHEMYNAKSSYLISINIANRIKDKYYHDDLPELLDGMQLAAEARVGQLVKILQQACDIDAENLDARKKAVETARSVVLQNTRGLDTAMFIEHNRQAWRDPSDFVFQPSPVWHEEGEFQTDENGLRYLRARLAQAESAADSASQASESALSGFDSAKSEVTGAADGTHAGKVAPLLMKYGRSLQRLVHSETDRLSSEVEIETIEAATAGCDLSGIPITRTKTTRGMFGKKKEIVEVVQPNDGRRGGGGRLGLKSLLARAGAKGFSGGGSKAHVAYDFAAGADGELSVSAGETLDVVHGDDGSGWVAVRRGGEEGLVPAAYVELSGSSAETSQAQAQTPAQTQAQPPKAPPPRGSSSSKSVTALYDFSGDAGQLSIKVGDVIRVLEGDNGGWTKGELHGVVGIFPTAYAR